MQSFSFNHFEYYRFSHEFVQFLMDIDSYFSREWGINLPRNEDYQIMIKNEPKT